MIDIAKFRPYTDLPIWVETKHGRRMAINSTYWGLTYLDCTNSLQDIFCQECDILGWEYVDDCHMLDCKFIRNESAAALRQRQADKTLQQVFQPWYKRLMNRFKRK